MASKFTNCGEYLPGQEPVSIFPLSTGGVYIPGNPGIPGGKIIIPQEPDPPSSAWFCEEYQSERCPPPLIGIQIIRKRCLPCDGQGGRPPSTDPRCVHQSLPDCQRVCKDQRFVCEEPPPNGGQPGNQGQGNQGPGGPGGQTGGPQGPASTGPRYYRKCGPAVIEQCPRGYVGRNISDKYGIPHQNVKSINYPCIPCTPGTADCSALSLQAAANCDSLCPSVSYQCAPITGPREGEIVIPRQTGIIIPNAQSNVITNNTKVRIENNISILSLVQNSQDQSTLRSIGYSESFYDPKLNFFAPNSQRLNSYADMVLNKKYLDIFSNYVSEEVAYLLNYENSNHPWDESKLQTITIEKVTISLNSNLLLYINNINDAAGMKLDPKLIVEAIKRHLITGTINEFDPSFYKEVYERQRNDEIVNYDTLSIQDYLNRAATYIIDSSSILANTSDKEPLHARQVRRQRRLNEDINAKTCACTLEGSTKELLIENAGICVTLLDNQNIHLENSPGDGYYLYLNTVDNGCLSFKYDTDVSAAIMTTIEGRNQALKILNQDSSLRIIASSVSGQHELTYGDTANVEFEPMYFKLVLDSISSDPTFNPLVETLSARFERIVDESEINEHLDNNGFTVARINIDYRDPLYRYIHETSSLVIEQNEINFKQFNLNRTITKDKIITRSIPFGLVITPVRGTRLNPLNGISIIQSYTNDVITRSLSMIPSFNRSVREPIYPELDVRYLYETNNSYKVGLVEPIDAQNITYRFDPQSEKLKNTFYDPSTKTYTSSINPVSSYGLSYLVKDVLDYIYDEYEPTQVTWFDLYRRMPLFKFGELFYDGDLSILKSLQEGGRHNIKIKHVLNRQPGVMDEILPDDSKVIIRVEDR